MPMDWERWMREIRIRFEVWNKDAGPRLVAASDATPTAVGVSQLSEI